MAALLFGSISALSDTSELQRASFNDAFAENGLDWTWEQPEYRQLLQGNGGRDRIADYAAARHQDVDATAVHQAKSELFQQRLGTAGVRPRAGVVDTIRAAKEHGWKVGLVTTTSPANVDSLLAALAPEVDRKSFDVVVDASKVQDGKPSPAAYRYALHQLGEQPEDCVAVEDNVGGVASAATAGVVCVAFANENTAEHDFGSADRVTELAFDDLAARRPAH